ncbi:methionine sulfoxide reductase A [Vibrionales bacterium SWAT-3]|nr:methionine sulfoxide reductase A [Vibrionales bacterium SWAT-3]
MEQIYLAGGCLWGVQEFIKYVPGVIRTEAGRANGSAQIKDNHGKPSDYDGYAECVQIEFDPNLTSVTALVGHLFEIIDPYSVNKQGVDVVKSIALACTAPKPNTWLKRSAISHHVKTPSASP